MLVDEDAVVDPRAGRCQELDVRDDPDSRHYEVALNHPPARRSHALHPAQAFERCDGIAEHQLHALLAMDGGEHLADLLTEDSG